MKLLDMYQEVGNWITSIFSTANLMDPRERSFRFLEESLELFQSMDRTKEEALNLVNYVYSRPKEPDISTEVGGVITTLMGVCQCMSIDPEQAYKTDSLKRWDSMDKIRAKQAYKYNIGMGRAP